MKGKAVLTLCDAASGKVVKRMEESNMVTNALNRIFSPPQTAMLYNWNLPSALKNMLPMWKNVLGGIMLLGNQLEENADSFMLPPGFTPVGSAGDAYSGSNVMRGSLNENESYETENGYHFTWDFATDKANGTIRSIALTSRYFGNAGFTDTELSDGSFYIDPSNFGVPTSGSITFKAPSGYFIGSFQPRIFTYCSRENSNTLVFRNCRVLNPKAININDTIWNGSITDAAFEEFTLTTPFSIGDARHFFFDPDKLLLYFFGYEGNSQEENALVRYFTVNTTTFEITGEGSVTVPKSTYGMVNAAIYGGKLYMVRGEGVAVYSLSGELLRLFTVSENVNNRFFAVSGQLMSCAYVNGKAYNQYYTCDGDVRTASIQGVCSYSTDIKLPYTLYTSLGGSGSYAYLMMLSNYLATINNLSEPIVKTNAHTLKISYDITN